MVIYFGFELAPIIKGKNQHNNIQCVPITKRLAKHKKCMSQSEN